MSSGSDKESEKPTEYGLKLIYKMQENLIIPINSHNFQLIS